MYTIDRDSDVPLYIQIRDSIIQAVNDGRLKAGDRLLSVANMAQEIGVTQATVRRALQDLAESGFTDSHVGRGTFIKGTGQDVDGAEGEGAVLAGREPGEGTEYGVQDHFRKAATRRIRSAVSVALYEIMPLAHKPGIIQLTQGIPDPSMLPVGVLEEISTGALANGGPALLKTTEPQGLYELRRVIAERESRGGVTVTPDMVLITGGVSQAIALAAQSIINRRMRVVCETPGFLGISNSFAAMGHWVETVQRDGDGPDMERLNALPKDVPWLLYVCPYVHNPTGTNMSPQRMEEVSRWARERNSIVISDEIFRDLRYVDRDNSGFLSALGPERTFTVNSLSKSVMTGLRLGWIIGSPERISQLSGLKKLMDQACPTLIQYMALELLKSGRYDEIVSAAREVYARRMEVMVDALTRLMPDGVTWSRPEGGFSLMLELPKGYSSVALLLTAVERGVSFLPGPLFDVDHRYVNAIRLSCAWTDELRIKEGVELLADSIAEFIARPPEDSGLSGLGGYQ